MTDYPDIFVLRHGQTQWNAEGRHQGRQDSPLTERGRGQARAQGQLLAGLGLDWAGIDAFCSPQGRAKDTAELALAPVNLEPTQDARLMEVSFGAWEGLTLADIEVQWPEVDHEGDPFLWHFKSPGGESFEGLRGRAKDFLGGLVRPSVIVTHGITSRMLRGLWLGLDGEGMGALPGGQGVIYHLTGGEQRQLRQ